MPPSDSLPPIPSDLLQAARQQSQQVPVELPPIPSSLLQAARPPQSQQRELGFWDRNPYISAAENVGNYTASFGKAMVVNPIRQALIEGPYEAAVRYRSGNIPPVLSEAMKSVPGAGMLPKEVIDPLLAVPLGYSDAGIKLANENLPPEQLPATEREVWASRLGGAAAMVSPAVRAMGPWKQLISTYFAGRVPEVAMDRYNQETGAKPEMPLGDWAKETAIKEPLNAAMSVVGVGMLGRTAHKKTGDLINTARRGKAITSRILDRDMSLADALVRTPEEGIIRVPGGKKEFGQKNMPLSRALEQDLPELKDALTSLGAAQKEKPRGEGSLFDDVVSAVGEIKNEVVTKLDGYYSKIPEEKTITYRDLLDVLEKPAKNGVEIAALKKPRQVVHTQELLTAAKEVLQDPITYRQEQRDLHGKLIYTVDKKTGKRTVKTELITEPESVAFTHAYQRIATDHGERGSRFGRASNADRALVARLMEKIKSTKIPIEKLRDYDTQFSSQAGYKDRVVDADKAETAAAYQRLADNARALKYKLMEENLSPEEFADFSKTNRKYSIALKVGELADKRSAEVIARGRGVSVPPTAIRNSAEGQQLSGLSRLLPGQRLTTDPEEMIRIAAPRNAPLSTEPMMLPLARRAYAGVERVGESVLSPVARTLNNPLVGGALAAQRTRAADDPHPIRQIAQWTAGKASAGMENLRQVYDMLTTAPLATPEPVLTPDQPMPRDTAMLKQHADAFLQRASMMVGNDPEIVSMIKQTLESPNEVQQQQALAELAKQVPGLFAQSEYPSEMNGKLYDPMDKDEFSRRTEKELRLGQINSIAYGKKMKAMNIDGTIYREPQQQGFASTSGSQQVLQTTQGNRRDYDY